MPISYVAACNQGQVTKHCFQEPETKANILFCADTRNYLHTTTTRPATKALSAKSCKTHKYTDRYLGLRGSYLPLSKAADTTLRHQAIKISSSPSSNGIDLLAAARDMKGSTFSPRLGCHVFSRQLIHPLHCRAKPEGSICCLLYK